MTLVSAKDTDRVIPKRFFVVTPFGEDEASLKASKDIAAGVLNGVQGISDRSEIIMQWYGIARDAILSMDAEELIRLNSLSRIQYDNPDYLVSNGMSALYRVFNKNKDFKYGPKALANNLKDHVASALKERPMASGLVSNCKQVADVLNKASVALEAAVEGLPPDPDDRKQVLRETGLYDSDLDYLQKAIRKTEEDCRDFADYAKDGRFNERNVEIYLGGEYSYERWLRELAETMAKADDAINYVTDYGFDDEVVQSVATLLDALANVQKVFARVGELRSEATTLLAEQSQFADVGYKAERGGLLTIFEDASAGFPGVKTVKGLAALIQKSAQKDSDLKKLTVAQWEKLLRKGLDNVGKTYKSEGEWLVKNRKLLVPKGSTLWISKYPLPEDVEARRQAGETTKMDDFVHGWAIDGNNTMDRLIKDLNLEQRYTVRRIDKKKFDEARNKWATRSVSGSVVEARYLYHGTSLENAKKIMESCLEPQVGPFVEEAYGEYDDLDELAFFADDNELQKAVNGMIKSVSFQLNKDAHSITEEDVKKHGALLVFEDIETEHREHRDDDDDEHPVSVEPGDYYTEDCHTPDRMIAGNDLIRFLKRRGAAPTWGGEADRFRLEQDKRRLISLARKAHPDRSPDEIRKKVLELKGHELAKYLRVYEEEKLSATATGNKSIKQIATEVLKKLGRCELTCVNHATVLRDALRAAGYPADRVYGYVLTDGVWKDDWGSGEVEWAADEELPKDRRGGEELTDFHMDHNWVEVGDTLVDIGCEQFNPLIRGEEFPSVYISKKNSALRHDKIEVISSSVSSSAASVESELKRPVDRFSHRWAIDANERLDGLIKDLNLEQRYTVRRIDKTKFDEARSKWASRPVKGSADEPLPEDDLEAFELWADFDVSDEEREVLKERLKQYKNFVVPLTDEVLNDVFIVDDNVVTLDGDEITIEEKNEWLDGQYRLRDKVIDALEEQFKNDFLEYPSPLYHATPSKSVASIMKNGLKPMAKTRGLSNRGVGAAIFTADDLDYISDSYGDAIFKIDVPAMKQDGVEFSVEKEPAVFEGEAMGALAHRLGIDDYYWESGDSGADDPSTVILHVSSVDPKYLSLVNRHGEVVSSSATELYHTTSLSGLASILKSKELRGHPYVSLSEHAYTGDISFNDVTIVFDAKAFGDNIEKVQYTQDWFDSHGEQASYIAGDGWAEQYEVPEDCFDEEGFEDTDCSDRAYREAEFMSFTHKSNEREWISKNRRPLSFPESAVLRVIVHKDNVLSAVEEVLSTHGYAAEAVYTVDAVKAATHVSASTLEEKNGRPKGAFLGDDDGTWEYSTGYPLGHGRNWYASIGLSSANEWKNLSVEGATEWNGGFRAALKEIVKEYPQVLEFTASFDGPAVKVSDLVASEPDLSNLVLLHGTSTAVLPSISKEGLRPRGDTGAPPAYGARQKPSRAHLVYLTSQPQMARFAALAAAKVHGGEPVILEVSDVDWSKAEPDEDSREDTAEASLARLGSIGYRGTLRNFRVRGSVSASAGKKTVYHVGNLDAPRKKPHVSYEGSGLSVSLHPEKWRKIARGKVSGDTWALSKEDPKFLLANKANQKKARQWAIDNGWLKSQTRYQVSWFDDEMDDTMAMTFDSLDEAKEEAEAYGVEVEEIDSVALDSKGLTYWREAFSSRPSNSLAESFAILWYAESKGYDGVWWNDKLDPARLSAPRGVIFQSNLPEWSKTKVEKPVSASAEAPKDFRLMFRLPNKDVPDLGEQLARGVLKGVAGITDSGKVLMLRMLGQNRNAMLVMPGAAVLAANDLERVEYDNPDYLMANDMAVAQRIMGQSHTKQSTIERILREAASFRSPVKDFMTTWGNLDVFPSEQLADVPLDSALDFAAELFALSKPKVEAAMQRNASLGKDFVQERYGPLLDPDNYLKAVNAGLLAFGRSFIWEGEWLVNNKTLRIPDGSRLFVMKEGSLAESAKQTIEQYQLADRYPVRYVDASKMERAGYALGQHAEQLTKERWKLSSKALDISSPVATMPAMPTKKRKVRANVPLSFAEAKDAMADAVEKSAEEGIPVALGGGFAMQAYGSDRLTQDVDLIATKLPSFAADGDDLVVGGKSVDINGIPIDVIVRADDYADLYEEAVQKAKPKAGYAVKVITPEYLVAMKMVAGRPKDDLDLNYLLSSVKMDMPTLKSVVQRFLGRYAVTDLASRIQEAKWMKKAGKL